MTSQASTASAPAPKVSADYVIGACLDGPGHLLHEHRPHHVVGGGTVDVRVRDVPSEQCPRLVRHCLGKSQRLPVEGLEHVLPADDAQLLAMGVIGEGLDDVRAGVDEITVELRHDFGVLEHHLGDIGARLEVPTALALEQVALRTDEPAPSPTGPAGPASFRRSPSSCQSSCPSSCQPSSAATSPPCRLSCRYPTVYWVVSLSVDIAGAQPPARTPFIDRHDITDGQETAESSETTETNEPTENAEANEPTDPIESADPTDPIESTDPREAMQRSESSEARDHFDWLRRARAIRPSWPGVRSCAPRPTFRFARGLVHSFLSGGRTARGLFMYRFTRVRLAISVAGCAALALAIAPSARGAAERRARGFSRWRRAQRRRVWLLAAA